VLHVHNLLNLSLDLPSIARARGIRTVATLHDYTLVCVSGGQRVHAADNHVCTTIDAARCSRCFAESAFATQLAAGRLLHGRRGRVIGRAATALRAVWPRAIAAASRRLPAAAAGPGDIQRRLAYARHAFDAIDLFVAPSESMAEEFRRLGVASERLVVSDYGFVQASPLPRDTRAADKPLRVGFVGTLVWHKGAHILLEAARGLKGAFEIHLHGEVATFPRYVDGLRQSARGLPVTFHGGFSRESTALVYDNLDVLVVPSLWPENSPLVIHEAFQAGVPVVGARIGGIPELVDHEVNGLLYDHSSSSDLALGLQSLIDRPDRLEAFRANLPPVRSIEEDARGWERIYAEVLASRPERRP